VKSELLTFTNFLYTDSYFLTTMDLWLLVNKYKIPTCFISIKYLLQTNYETQLFIGYGNKEDKFAFILVPGLRAENIPGFKIIETDNKEIFISLNNITGKCLNKINKAITNKFTIQSYLQNFNKQNINKKKQPFITNNLIIIKEPDNNTDPEPLKEPEPEPLKDPEPLKEPESLQKLTILPNKTNPKKITKKKKIVLKGTKKNNNK